MSNQLTQPAVESAGECSAAHLREQRERFLRKLADIARKTRRLSDAPTRETPPSDAARLARHQTHSGGTNK